MKSLETRYQDAIEKIGRLNMLNLPGQVKEVLKSTKNLETKVKMLEAIVERK